MRLDLDCIHIEDVRFGAKTVIENHALSIDRQELTLLLDHSLSAPKSDLRALRARLTTATRVCWRLKPCVLRTRDRDLA